MFRHWETMSDPKADQIVFALDEAGNFKLVNRVGELACGYSCAELRRMNVLDLLPNKNRDNLAACVRRAISRRVGAVFETEVATRDGRRMLLEVSVDLIRTADRSLEFECVAIPLENRSRGTPSRPRCLDKQFRPRWQSCQFAPGWLAYK